MKSEQEKGVPSREVNQKSVREDRYVKECTKRKDIKNVNERLRVTVSDTLLVIVIIGHSTNIGVRLFEKGILS